MGEKVYLFYGNYGITGKLTHGPERWWILGEHGHPLSARNSGSTKHIYHSNGGCFHVSRSPEGGTPVFLSPQNACISGGTAPNPVITCHTPRLFAHQPISKWAHGDPFPGNDSHIFNPNSFIFKINEFKTCNSGFALLGFLAMFHVF